MDFGRLNEAGDKFLVAYELVQRGSSTKFDVKGAFDQAREDAGWNLAAAKGIETAMTDLGGTNRPYNIAILPAEREGMYVYLYPAQVKSGRLSSWGRCALPRLAGRHKDHRQAADAQDHHRVRSREKGCEGGSWISQSRSEPSAGKH